MSHTTHLKNKLKSQQRIGLALLANVANSHQQVALNTLLLVHVRSTRPLALGSALVQGLHKTINTGDQFALETPAATSIES